MIRITAGAAAAIAIWLAWPAPEPKPVPVVHEAPAPAARHSKIPAAGMPFFAAPPDAPAPISGAESLAATWLHGDPQAPPIGIADASRAMPTPAELADPKAYQAYEARQQERVYASYVKAVDAELPILRNDIARGRSLGIDPKKIAKAEEKVRRLEQMRAELLNTRPELGR